MPAATTLRQRAPRARSRTKQPPRVGFVSLGCAKALVDSERIVTRLRTEGYEIAPTTQSADVVVVNTCGFLVSARKRIAGGDRRGHRRERQGGGHRLPRRHAGPHPRHPPEGPGGHRAAPVRRRAGGRARGRPAAARAVPGSGAAAGPAADAEALRLPEDFRRLQQSLLLLHHPASCAATSSRRRPPTCWPRPRRWSSAGVSELLVISQDTSAYGVDLRYAASAWHGGEVRARFLDLCRALGELGAWVRLHYVYPYPHVDEVIPLMAEGKILPYLDIPFQHASPDGPEGHAPPGHQGRCWTASAAGARSAPTSRCARPSSSVFPARPRPTSLPARLAERGADRSGRLLPLRAGRGRSGQRACRMRCPRRSRRSAGSG